MKLRLVIEVPLKKEKDFYPQLDSDTREVERTLPATAVVVNSEYVQEADDAKSVFKALLRLKLESEPLRGFKSGDYYSKGDEEAPFFSEAYLYNLVGKDDARTVLGHLHHLMKYAGLDPLMVERELNAEIAAEKKEEEDRQARIKKYREFKEKFIKDQGWKRDQKTFSGFTPEQDAILRKALKDSGL